MTTELPVKSITMKADFRSFTKGKTFVFDNRVTVLAGDNGTGKSTLTDLIRSRLEAETSMKSIVKSTADQVVEEPRINKRCFYIDLANDSLKDRTDHSESTNLSLHIGCATSSTGQASMMQLVTQLAELKTDVLIIDEPERGLSDGRHHLISQIITEWIMKNPESQVIVITHSRIIMEAVEKFGEVRVMPFFKKMGTESYFKQIHEIGLKVADNYRNTVL